MDGPRLVLVTAFVLGTVSAAILGPQGAAEEPLRVMLRWTARVSLVLFLLAFSASSLRRAWHGPASNGLNWLLRNRRYIGLSFAVSHAIHLIFIIALHIGFPVETPPALLYGGGFGYVMIALMASTSNDASVRFLGARRWRAVHLVGGYTLWAVFAAVYLPNIASVGGVLPSLGLLGALGLRIYSRNKNSTQ